MAQSAASTCEICCAGPGEKYCQQCDQLFCGSCKLSHLRTKSCQNHTFSSGPNMNREEKLLCTEHKDSFLFYCHDCDTPVCKICSVKKHSRHLMTDLAESTEKLRSDLVEKIKSKEETSNLNLSKIEENTKAYREEIKAVIKSITEEGNNWKKLIDKKVESLVKLVQDGEQKALQSMSVLTQFNKELLGKCQQWQINVKDMDTTEDVSLLQKLKQIKTDIDKRECKQILDGPYVSYRNRKSSGTEIDTLFGELKLQKGKTFRVNKDKQQHARPEAMQKRYKYVCAWCRTEKVSTNEPGTSTAYGGPGKVMVCKNSKCSGHNHTSCWHDFIGEA
ncbi:tripartite motif-containing protein 46-like [Mytilus trossulus]|uniref:tripartite motif-containing protein 46-like n=1 Tax=Mytilus trossulus TaxID=6551 RepID=UPI003004CBF8